MRKEAKAVSKNRQPSIDAQINQSVAPISTRFRRVTRIADYYSAFVLRDQDVEKLVRELETHVGPVTFEAECSDSMNRHFTSLQDLIDFDNPHRKSIRTLKLIAQGEGAATKAHVWLSVDREHNVQFYLDAAEETALRLNAAIEDKIASLRPWFSIFRRGNMAFTATLAWFGSMWVAISRGWIISGKQEHVSEEVGAQSNIHLLILTGSIVGMALLLAFLRTRFFPAGTFAFGQGASDYKTDETARQFIVGALISLVIGAVLLQFGS